MKCLCLVLLAIPAATLAIDTDELALRHGSTNDGAVAITRSSGGEMLFQDTATAATSLSDLTTVRTDHGALTGLSDDDHPQYQNAARHTAAHDAAFDNALPVSGDVNTNATLGAHVSDSAIHLKRGANESVTGSWNFVNGVTAASNTVRLTQSQFTTEPALQFEAGASDAELVYTTGNVFTMNRPLQLGSATIATSLTGGGGSTISGFSTIAGIASTDLVSSTAAESVSGAWTFVGAVDAQSSMKVKDVRLTGLPTLRLRVKNGGVGSVSAGDLVVFSGESAGLIEVTDWAASISSTTPIAGVALATTASGAQFDVLLSGVTDVPGLGPIVAGDALTWDGSAFEPGAPAIAFALNAQGGTGPVKVWLRITGW
ncbi:hypothetical protein BH09SUM1_BH09SUM1_07260 [soil metagenome]